MRRLLRTLVESLLTTGIAVAAFAHEPHSSGEIPTISKMKSDAKELCDARAATYKREIDGINSGKIKVAAARRKAILADLQEHLSAAENTTFDCPSLALEVGSYGKLAGPAGDFRIRFSSAIDSTTSITALSYYRNNYKLVGKSTAAVGSSSGNHKVVIGEHMEVVGSTLSSTHEVVLRGVSNAGLAAGQPFPSLPELLAITSEYEVGEKEMLVIEPMQD